MNSLVRDSENHGTTLINPLPSADINFLSASQFVLCLVSLDVLRMKDQLLRVVA